MRRDMDLVREVLLGVEEGVFRRTDEMFIPPYEKDAIVYHVKLMKQGNLIDVVDFSTPSKPLYGINGLTWEGQNFLDLARDDQKWEAAKTLVFEKAGGLNYELLKAVLLVYA